MSKPALVRPKTVELMLGLVLVLVVGGIVLARGGIRSTNADQPHAADRTAALSPLKEARQATGLESPDAAPKLDELVEATVTPASADRSW